jgi:polar amino acid transport system substrate-binding protein
MLTALVVVCAAMTVTAFAAPKSITVATDATWPPMEMVDANKKIVGYDIDFINAVAKEAGITVEFKNTAWDGIFAGLDTGKYDAIISSVTITDERKAKYDFSDAYTSIGQILVVPKTDKTSKTLADLKGRKVGSQIGTTGAMEVKKVAGVESKTYDEIGLAFEDMSAGRISGVVCDEPVAAHFALQKKEYKEKFKIVGKAFTKEGYGIVVKKGNKELVDLLNKGIKAVKAKKLDTKIHTKWVK